jgi:hypothetical protein
MTNGTIGPSIPQFNIIPLIIRQNNTLVKNLYNLDSELNTICNINKDIKNYCNNQRLILFCEKKIKKGYDKKYLNEYKIYNNYNLNKVMFYLVISNRLSIWFIP